MSIYANMGLLIGLNPDLCFRQWHVSHFVSHTTFLKFMWTNYKGPRACHFADVMVTNPLVSTGRSRLGRCISTKFKLKLEEKLEKLHLLWGTFKEALTVETGKWQGESSELGCAQLLKEAQPSIWYKAARNCMSHMEKSLNLGSWAVTGASA